jgi:hypothetical protein
MTAGRVLEHAVSHDRFLSVLDAKRQGRQRGYRGVPSSVTLQDAYSQEQLAKSMLSSLGPARGGPAGPQEAPAKRSSGYSWTQPGATFSLSVTPCLLFHSAALIQILTPRHRRLTFSISSSEAAAIGRNHCVRQLPRSRRGTTAGCVRSLVARVRVCGFAL